MTGVPFLQSGLAELDFLSQRWHVSDARSCPRARRQAGSVHRRADRPPAACRHWQTAENTENECAGLRDGLPSSPRYSADVCWMTATTFMGVSVRPPSQMRRDCTHPLLVLPSQAHSRSLFENPLGATLSMSMSLSAKNCSIVALTHPGEYRPGQASRSNTTRGGVTKKSPLIRTRCKIRLVGPSSLTNASIVPPGPVWLPA